MRFDNRSWKTGTRAIWALSGAALIGAVVIYETGGPTGLGDQLVDAVIFCPLFIAFCRLGGIPAAQPFVEIRQDGIAYGKRQFIPWAAVTGVDWSKRGLDRKKRLVVRASGWKARGPVGFVIKRSPLPLSGLDNSKDPEEWLSAFRTFAPAIPLPPSVA